MSDNVTTDFYEDDEDPAKIHAINTSYTSISNLVCNCNTVWGSILPPPPCLMHAVAYNGLCTCRGSHWPHPFHAPNTAPAPAWTDPRDRYSPRHVKKQDIPWTTWTTSTITNSTSLYYSLT